MSNASSSASWVATCQRYSIPLILGVIVALVIANVMGEHEWHHIVDYELFSFELFGKVPITLTPHWLINDVFMVFFFGIAAKEITEAMAPGGALNPPSKALNPLFGTLGGILGPVAVFLILTSVIGGEHADTIRNGWGIPTATDIALAWLCARVVFGEGHPAIDYLLLLAIADDAIGLGIIAFKYGDPNAVTIPALLALIPLAMLIAFGMRKAKVMNWALYILIPGVLCWLGLLSNGLHPALALVPIVPFMPMAYNDAREGSPLLDYEHTTKLPVDFGMFFFGLANAGVAIGAMEPVTVIVLGSLILGKTIGITFFGSLGHMLGAKFPTGMTYRHVFTAGIVAALGLTVALFVAGQAYKGEAYEHLQSGAKLGALLSVVAAVIAVIVGRVLNVKKLEDK